MKKRKKKQRETESVAESFAYMFTWILRVLVTVYTVLILAVLPLYFEQGYTHIGTDKSTFFRTTTMFMARFIVPALLLSGVFTLIVRLGSRCKQKTISALSWLDCTDWFAFV